MGATLKLYPVAVTPDGEDGPAEALFASGIGSHDLEHASGGSEVLWGYVDAVATAAGLGGIADRILADFGHVDRIGPHECERMAATASAVPAPDDLWAEALVAALNAGTTTGLATVYE